MKKAVWIAGWLLGHVLYYAAKPFPRWTERLREWAWRQEV